MGKFEVIKRMLSTTSNFWVVPKLKGTSGTKEVHFCNGVKLHLDLAGYRNYRDLFYRLKQLNFKVVNGMATKQKPAFNYPIPTAEQITFFDFLVSLNEQGWTVSKVDPKTVRAQKLQATYEIEALGDKLFSAKDTMVSFIGPVESLGLLPGVPKRSL